MKSLIMLCATLLCVLTFTVARPIALAGPHLAAARADIVRYDGAASQQQQTNDQNRLRVQNAVTNLTLAAVTMTSYSGVNCGGDALEVTAVMTGTCLASSTKSFYYTCMNGMASETVYSGTTCDKSKIEGVTNYMVGCNAVSAEKAGPTSGQSYLIECSLSNAWTLPSSATPYAVQRTFQSNCDNLIGLNAFRNDYCYVNGTGSFEFQLPFFYEYASSTACKGTPYYTETLPALCMLDTATDDGNWGYNAYSSWTIIDSTLDIDWDDDFSTLSGGAIAGIVIGVLCLVGLIAGLIFFCVCRKAAVN